VFNEITVGNKCDRDDRCVSTEEAKQLASELKINFIETSAKDNSNVEEVTILFYYMEDDKVYGLPRWLSWLNNWAAVLSACVAVRPQRSRVQILGHGLLACMG